MKEYSKKGLCYCGGPESCDVCRPTKESKKSVRKRTRQKAKKEIRESDINLDEDVINKLTLGLYEC